jgi:hypothetical protein
MADQYDRDLERDSQRRGGAGEPARDETEGMERKLKRSGGDDLAGDAEENRNLSGSTTWQTLPSQADEHGQHARKGQAESPNDLTHEEQPKQRKPGGRTGPE